MKNERPAYSKSKIDTFKKCKLQFDYKYNKKMYLDQPHSDDLQFGHWIHQVLEDYSPDKDNIKDVVKLAKKYDIRGKGYIDAMATTLKNAIAFTKKYWKYERQVEEKIRWEGKDMTLTGIMDLRMKLSKDTLMIVDYKSSKNPAGWRHEYQMKMYVLMVMHLYDMPAEKIRPMIYYPRIEKFDTYQFGTGEMKAFEKEVLEDIEMIEGCEDFTAAPGFHCRWCPYLGTEYCDKGEQPK